MQGATEREDGLTCLSLNDTVGAVEHFWAALKADQAQEDVPHYLAVSLCLNGEDSAFLRLVDACQGSADAPLNFYHTVLLDLMNRRAWATLERHVGHTLPQTRLEPIAHYYAGCAALAQNQHDRALQHFEKFRTIVMANHKAFPLVTSPIFNLIFRQACLLEPSPAVAELLNLPADQFVRGRPTIERPAPLTPAAGDVFVSCCDSAYFKRFAKDLTRSMRHRPHDLLHFHIACPDEDCFQLVEELRRMQICAVNFSVERAPAWHHNVYYACNRFLVAPAIMDWYGKSIVILDADSILLGDLSKITDRLHEWDFACFNTGRTEPASLFQATITHFANNARGRRFLEVLARLIIPKLDMPWSLSWMLDQAALYSAVRYVEAYEPEIRIGDLAEATGGDLRRFIGGLGSEDEKWQMMSDVGSVRAG